MIRLSSGRVMVWDWGVPHQASAMVTFGRYNDCHYDLPATALHRLFNVCAWQCAD